MKISWNYLQSFFEEPLDKASVLERLTMAGLEVEGEASVAPEFSGIVIGKVIECERHPDADKLSICKVDVNKEEPLQIICGASNVKVGVKIPCAKVGAVLPGDFKIAERKMRGIVSYGMLCSGDEIGYPDGVDGLLLLPEDAPIGTDIRDYLDLDDTIVEFKITPNRGDCLSYQGLVREIAALNNTKIKECANLINYLVTPATEFKLNVEAKNACPHYVGLMINQVNNNVQSPAWLVKILERSGIRSISPLVDITNYVMLVLGQPMHAFDLAKISGGLNVRLAKPGETLKLLDGKLATISTDTLVICDGQNQPAAIAGVMGGNESGVTSETTAILLESAHFAPDAIRGKAKHYGVSSDSAFRFERGVDPEIQHDAINLAAKLVQEICGGEVLQYVHYSNPEQQQNTNTIKLNFRQINEFVGEHIDDQLILSILANLGCKVVVDNGELSITTPSYRFDLAIKEDIIEEIVRVYGYDRITPIMPKLHYTMNSLDQHSQKLNGLKQTLVSNGFSEIISYAFIEDKYAEIFADKQKPLIKLQNPIAGLNVLRNNLLSDLAKALQHNVNRGVDSLKIFELARVFHSEEATGQPLYLAGLIYGKNNQISWAEKVRDVDFFDMKFAVEELLNTFGNLKFIADTNNPVCHPGRTAMIELNGQVIGFMGQLHPRLKQELGLDKLPYLFEINLELIGMPQEPQVRSISKFQKVSRDLAFVFDEKIAIGGVIDSLKELAIPELISVRVFDIFQGGNLEANQKSVAINFMFQADRTLTEEEISSYLLLIKQLVTQKFGAELR